MGFTDRNYIHLHFIFILWVISLLLLSNPGFGAEATDTPLSFITIDNPELNSIGEHFASVQDQQGFMWFGGAFGLARYDGYNAKVYRNSPQDPHSLGHNWVHDLLLDTAGRMWVATLGGGLNLYDPSTDRFTRYRHDPDNPHSLSHDAVTSLSESKDGKLWVATYGGGLNLFNPNSQRFTRYQHNAADPGSISSNILQTVYEDHDGMAWIGTADAGLNRFNPQTGAVSRFSHDSRDPGSLGEGAVWTIYENNQRQLWVGTRGGGLNRLDRATGKFIRYLYDPQNSQSLGADHVRGIAERDDGTLWVATEGGGLNLLDPATGRFKRYLHRPGDPSSLPNNKLRTLYQDKDGNWWFGHFPDGVSRLNPYASAFSVYRHAPWNDNSLSHNSILGLTEDDLGNLWVGTEDGLNYLDRTSGAITRYIHDPQDSGSLGAPAALAVLEDSYGQVWVGTWGGGLNRLNSETGTFARHLPDASSPHSISSDTIWSLYEDADQNLWVGTGTAGLYRYDRETNHFSAHQAAPNNPASLTPGIVHALYEDSRGHFWVGTSGGLNMMNRETGSFTRYLHREGDPHSLSANYIWCITEDSKARLWLGTDGGLNRLDRETGRFTVYRAKDGLAGNAVTGIIEDNQGYLWVSTERGLSRFDPRTEEFRNYDTQHGLPGHVFNRPSFLKTSNGELVFGSTAGLAIFNPANLFEDALPPPVVITDFELFNQPVEIGVQNSPLKQSINHSKEITLRHDQSVVSLAFAALNYRVPKKNQYAYQLEGFDKNWNYVDNKRTATYTNLDPGRYVFRVKAANSEGVWNEEGASIMIRVLPPWWQTWWAYVLYIVIVSAAIITYVHSQRRKLAYMEQIVDQRTRQLRQAELVAEKEKALQQSEAKFSAAFDHASIAKALVSPQGRILRVNPAWCALLGYSAPELLAMHFRDFTHPDDVDTSIEHMRRLVDGEIDTYETEKRYIHRDGHEVWGWLNSSLVRSTEGAPEFFISQIVDITERKQGEKALRAAEEKLVRARDEAEHANRTKSLFLTTASHDLRQPAQALSMLTSALERLADTSPLQQIVRRQHDALDAMTDLLNGLLDISKLEAGAVKPQPTDFQLKLTFEHMRDAFALQAQEKGIEFVVDTTHAIVHTDRILLERIIENLVANAIRYTEQGKVQLRCIEQPTCIRVEVIDTGIGIPESALQTILDEFHQVRDTHNRGPNEGLGLGLAIVDRMVDLLNIPMDVQSSPGEGSTFSIEIPIGTSAADITAPPSAVDTRKNLAGIQALVVDDDFGVRDSLQILLNIEGCIVTAAASLAEAVEGAITTPPDIIITDYHLPDAETGTDVVQRVREQTGQPVPAILISGDTSSALQAQLLEGCLLLSKPVVASELISSILDLAGTCAESNSTTSPHTDAL